MFTIVSILFNALILGLIFAFWPRRKKNQDPPAE